MRGYIVWAAAQGFTALLRFAFHLLYYPLAFTYDAVAWIVSGGEWADWRRSVIPHLLPGSVLEMAHGTGTLALEIADRGYPVTAVDLSPAMGKIALRKKRTRAKELGNHPASNPALVRADVRQLPFPIKLFSNAVSTFPADFIFQPQTLREVYRTLRPGGRWIIVPGAYPEWIASRLFPEKRIPPRNDIMAIFSRHLEETGFIIRKEIVRRPRSCVTLILAEKPDDLPEKIPP